MQLTVERAFSCTWPARARERGPALTSATATITTDGTQATVIDYQDVG